MALSDEEQKVVDERCAQGKHVVVTMVDTREERPRLFYACASCDTLWHAVTLEDPWGRRFFGLVEVEIDPEMLEQVRSQL